MAPTASPEQAAEPRQLEGLDPLRELVISLMEAARREVLLFSTDLQPQLYNQAPFLEALRRFAVNNRRARIRILVEDLERIVKLPHRLLELANQLPSFFEVRRVAEEDAGHEQCYLLVDRRGYLLLPSKDSRSGEACAHCPRQGRLLGAEFMELWDRAAPDPNLRRLVL
ncbi:MAG: hypothetical protein GX093_05000 [Xanthomonadaceae bacterium]|nr:hypothetical protein [Xanthomonadaceae bacterium]